MSRQTLARISAGSDHVVDVVQPGGCDTPRCRSNWLTGPTSGLSSMFHTTATATREVTYGKKNAVRKTPTPRSFWLSSTARPRDAASVSGMWPAAYQQVFCSAAQKLSSCHIRLKLAKPIHLGV